MIKNSREAIKRYHSSRGVFRQDHAKKTRATHHEVNVRKHAINNVAESKPSYRQRDRINVSLKVDWI